MKIAFREKPDVVVPVTSMADIAFLLIIFFLLTSSLVKESGLDIDLPQAKEAKEKQLREKNVAIDKRGQIYFNGVPVTAAELKVQLSELLKGAVSEEDKVVSIKGDEKAPFGDVVTVMDVVTGLEGRIVIISETEGSGKETEGKGKVRP